MKRSSGPRKTANLPISIHRELNAYAIAAGAAGVSVLALAHPAVARIVYTPAHVRIGAFNLAYTLDLNHDGHGDFILLDRTSCNSSFCKSYLSIKAMADNVVDGVLIHGYPAAFALTRGMRVNSRSHLGGRAILLDVLNSGGQGHCFLGYWCNVENRYLGLAFKLKGKVHYGWARLNVSFAHDGVNATLTGYAYETVPGKSIKAGQTKETPDGQPKASDYANPNAPTPGAFLANSAPDTPQPASLGMLALGAQGVPLRRRKLPLLAGD
jgi:hypothetical protein